MLGVSMRFWCRQFSYLVHYAVCPSAPPAVLFSEPEDRWDAVWRALQRLLRNSCSGVQSRASIGVVAEVAQVPAERRLTFAAIDAANAESSRRVKAATPSAQIAAQVALLM